MALCRPLDIQIRIYTHQGEMRSRERSCKHEMHLLESSEALVTGQALAQRDKARIAKLVVIQTVHAKMCYNEYAYE